MRRLVLLMMLAATCYAAYAHKIYKETAATIEERPLTWNDYSISPSSQGLTVALTHSRIQLDSVDIDEYGPAPVFKAKCFFMTDRSWVDANFLSNSTEAEKAHVLKHEQTHYDIARIATAQINREMNSFKYQNGRVAYQADSIFRTLSMKLRRIQKMYDDETSHSRQYDEQARWNQLVANCKSNMCLPEL